MVRFVHDDGIEIVRSELLQAFFAHKGLYATNGYTEPTAKTGFLRLLYGTAQTSSFQHLIGRLIQKFSPVSHNQHSVTVGHHIFC